MLARQWTARTQWRRWYQRTVDTPATSGSAVWVLCLQLNHQHALRCCSQDFAAVARAAVFAWHCDSADDACIRGWQRPTPNKQHGKTPHPPLPLMRIYGYTEWIAEKENRKLQLLWQRGGARLQNQPGQRSRHVALKDPERPRPLRHHPEPCARREFPAAAA